MISVQDAATRLQVSPQRVLVMLHTGLLVGVQIGKVWVVDEASVAARARTATGAGRPLAPSTARALINALTTPGDTALRARDRNFIVHSSAESFAAKIRQTCRVTRYSSHWMENVARHLDLTGDSAVNSITATAAEQLLPDQRSIHGYVRTAQALQTLIQDARLVEDPTGPVHVYMFRDEVFPWEQVPLALVASDCALSTSTRVKRAGLDALERMRAPWAASIS